VFKQRLYIGYQNNVNSSNLRSAVGTFGSLSNSASQACLII